jgi:hypothetical protein
VEQDDLETHLKHEDGPECPNNNLPPPKSMTASMKRKLSVRGKRDKNISEEDKWYDIYKLLFPNERRPTTSPCKFALHLGCLPVIHWLTSSRSTRLWSTYNDVSRQANPRPHLRT